MELFPYFQKYKGKSLPFVKLVYLSHLAQVGRWNIINFKYLFKDEETKLSHFKLQVKALRSKYELLNNEDLKLQQSKLEIDIDVLKNDNMLQIAVPLFALFPIVMINLVAGYRDSVQSTLQTNMKAIDIKLSEKLTKLDLDKLISQVKSSSEIVHNFDNDILYLFYRYSLILIATLIICLVLPEAIRLSKIRKLSKQLYVINNLIEERTALNSNWQLWK